MQPKLKKRIKIVVITTLSLFVLIVGCISLLLNTVVSPKKITPIINSSIATMVDGHTNIRNVDISFIRSFPNFRLEIDSIYVADSLDTRLLTLDKLVIDINPVRFLTSKRVVINDFKLVKPNINLYTSAKGEKNYSILKFLTAADTVSTDTTQFVLEDYVNGINIKSISIEDAKLVSVDDSLNNSLNVDGLSLKMRGIFSSKKSDLKMNLSIENVNGTNNGRPSFRDFTLVVGSDVEFDRDSLLLTIKDADVELRNIELHSSGTIRANKDSMNLETDLKFYLAINSLENIIKKLPPKFIKKDQRFKATGKVELEGTAIGVYDQAKGIIPTVNSSFVIDGGSFKFNSMPYGVQTLDLVSTLYIDGDDTKNSILDVTKFIVESDAGINIDTKLTVSDIMGDPFITFDVVSNANIAKVREVMPITDAITLEGSNTTSLKGSFVVSDVENQNYGAIVLSGDSEFNDLMLVMDGAKLEDTTAFNTYLYVEMKHGNFNFDSQVEVNNESQSEPKDESKNEPVINSDTLKNRRDRNNLKATLSFNGVGFRNRSGLEVKFSDINFSASTRFIQDTSLVTPVSGKLTLSRLDAAIADTLNCYITRSDIDFSIRGSKADRSKAIIELSVNADSVNAEAIVNKTIASLDAAMFDVKITPDSTKATGRAMEGSVNFKGLDLFSELFPIDINMRNSTVAFANNRVELSRTLVRVGNSGVVATGTVENLIGHMFNLNEDKIGANLYLNSRNIDLAELYLTSLAAEHGIAVDTTQIRQELANNAKDLVTIMQIPDYIDAKLDVDITKTTFGDLLIENMLGHIAVKEGLLTLDSLSLVGAGSKMNISALYSPLTDTTAHTSFDLNAKGIVLEELIKLVPAIDSIMPMLKSVEGSLDFDMVARGKFNKYMDLDLQSLQSVMRFDGRNMVLMDSETFTELSKTLMFKNKSRNIVDSLKLNVIIRPEGKIDVPPFKMIIDRYSAIIGGTQNIDYNTFDIEYMYNVSILKSPLPFKAGVDIKGTNEDYKFDITKAKLKNSNFVEINRNVDSLVNVVKVGKYDL